MPNLVSVTRMFGACLEKSRLKKSMHRVGILIAGMTTGALLVTDGGVAKRGVGGTQFEPELNFGLELLAHGSGRGLPNIHDGFCSDESSAGAWAKSFV